MQMPLFGADFPILWPNVPQQPMGAIWQPHAPMFGASYWDLNINFDDSLLLLPPVPDYEDPALWQFLPGTQIDEMPWLPPFDFAFPAEQGPVDEMMLHNSQPHFDLLNNFENMPSGFSTGHLDNDHPEEQVDAEAEDEAGEEEEPRMLTRAAARRLSEQQSTSRPRRRTVQSARFQRGNIPGRKPGFMGKGIVSTSLRYVMILESLTSSSHTA